MSHQLVFFMQSPHVQRGSFVHFVASVNELCWFWRPEFLLAWQRWSILSECHQCFSSGNYHKKFSGKAESFIYLPMESVHWLLLWDADLLPVVLFLRMSCMLFCWLPWTYREIRLDILGLGLAFSLEEKKFRTKLKYKTKIKPGILKQC